MTDPMQARIDALEIRVAHQDKIIADLSDMIAAQWRKLDDLERRFANLHTEVENIGAERGGHEPPPHY